MAGEGFTLETNLLMLRMLPFAVERYWIVKIDRKLPGVPPVACVPAIARIPAPELCTQFSVSLQKKCIAQYLEGQKFHSTVSPLVLLPWGHNFVALLLLTPSAL